MLACCLDSEIADYVTAKLPAPRNPPTPIRTAGTPTASMHIMLYIYIHVCTQQDNSIVTAM